MILFDGGRAIAGARHFYTFFEYKFTLPTSCADLI